MDLLSEVRSLVPSLLVEPSDDGSVSVFVKQDTPANPAGIPGITREGMAWGQIQAITRRGQPWSVALDDFGEGYLADVARRVYVHFRVTAK
jgi:hypothetical protein